MASNFFLVHHTFKPAMAEKWWASTSKFGEWAGGEKDEKETIVLYDNTSSAGTGFWAGTKSDGTFSGNNCKDWSTGNNSDNATLGQSYKFYNFLTLCY